MHDSRRVRLVLGVLLIAAIALITLDVRDGGSGPVRDLRAMGGSVFGTAESAVGAVTRPVADAAGGSSSSGQVAALQRQIIALRAELSQAQVSKADEAQLQRLLQLAGRGGYRIVAASVIAAGSSYEARVTIDVGSADGVKPQETVLNGAGLVGTVTAVSAHTATVVLLTDAASRVGVRMAGTGQIGLVSGTGPSQAGGGTLSLQVFDASAVLRPGEQLVTFGSPGGRPYVPGVPVGVITRVTSSGNSLTKRAEVRPFVNEATIGVVGVVIAPPRTNPRDSVLPPSPRPSPPVSPSPGSRGHGRASAAPTSSPAPTSSATRSGAGQSAGG